MTDNEINRLVAERVMGWTFPHLRPNSQFCTDPAAWAGLLVWLAADRKPRGVSLDTWPDEGLWEVTIGALDGERRVSVYDANPGRALALAALRAYGVTIE